MAHHPHFLPVLAAALLGVGAPASWALEANDFGQRLEAAQALAETDLESALSRLDALVVEAVQAGRADLQLLTTQTHAALKIRAGRLSGTAQEVEDALSLARQGGLAGYEAALGETYADYWLAQGDPLAAAEWLQRSFRLALTQPSTQSLAKRLAQRVSTVQRSMGATHLAAQADAWIAVLDDAPDAPDTGITLQPASTTTHVVSDEVARTRIFIANASPVAVTGTLMIDAGDLSVASWKSRGDREQVSLKFPGSQVVPDAGAQGRKLTLQPGESRVITLELDPGDPPQVTQKRVTTTWQAGRTSVTATADFHFRRSKEFQATTVANASHVTLSPLVSVPVYTEVYHRRGLRQHLQDLMPATSAPCRVELYELGTGAIQSRQLLAIDADGDGRFDGLADHVAIDRNRDHYPDVTFSDDKGVAALELRLYPLDPKAGALDLTVSLKDGTAFRDPPDTTSRIEQGR